MSQHLDVGLYPDLLNKPERIAALRSLVLPEETSGRKGQPTKVVKELKSTAELGAIDQSFADYSVDFIKRSAAGK